MAIDLFFYSSLPLEIVRGRLDSMENRNPNIFNKKFIIYPPKEASDLQKEFALEEHGLKNAMSFFLIGLNDKRAADEVLTVIEMVKIALGSDDVIVSRG